MCGGLGKSVKEGWMEGKKKEGVSGESKVRRQRKEKGKSKSDFVRLFRHPFSSACVVCVVYV